MVSAANRHMGRVAEVGCIVCLELGHRGTPAEVHHIGDSSDRSDWLTIPLCPDHHRGAIGYHGGPKRFEMMFGSELQLLGKTLREMARAT